MQRLIGALAALCALAAFAIAAPGAAHATSTAAHRVARQVPPPPDDRPLLSLGDTGPSVAAWQRQMAVLTDDGSIVVDGIYGTSTEMLTRNFQTFFGLRVDGIVGTNTRDVMRLLLSATRDYTELVTYGDARVVGFTSEGGYCFEVQRGDAFSTECGPPDPAPLSARAIAVEGSEDPLLLGTIDPAVARVVVDLDEGAVDAQLRRDVAGLVRDVWSTDAATPSVVAVRALDADGEEIRRVVIDGGDPVLILERGDRGPAVVTWQAQLNTTTGAGLATDGIFGESTVQATKNLQRFFGLVPDGIVGPQTRDLMQFVLALTT